MAGNYGPEIKSAMKGPGTRPSQVKKGLPETPADRVRDQMRGIKEGSPQDQKLDALPQNQAPVNPAPGGGPASPVPPHVQAAAGIAHAILANRGM